MEPKKVLILISQVSTCAVLVEAGRQLVERHAAASPLEKLPFTQSRAFLIVFLVFFMLVVTLAFGGEFFGNLGVFFRGL